MRELLILTILPFLAFLVGYSIGLVGIWFGNLLRWMF